MTLNLGAILQKSVQSLHPAVGAGGLVLALTSCAVGPDFHRPSPTLPTQFTRRTLPAATLAARVPGGDAQQFVSGDIPGRWWRVFGSPAIDRLVDKALRANPDLQNAQAALRAARESHLADRGPLLPQIEADANANRQKNPAVLASPLASNANYFGLGTAELNISYSPDLFGGIRRQYESSGAEVENQRYTLEAAYLTLTTNVVLAVFQEASLRGQIKAAKQSIVLNLEILTNLRAARRAGEAAAGDVAAQETALAQARQAVPPLDKQLAQSQDLIAVLTGGFPSESPDDAIELDQIQLPTTLPLSLPSKVVEQRPDIRAAEASLHQASALIGVAVANRLPTITLTALLGGSSTQLNTLFASQNSLWSLTAGVTQPIFQGGALLHKQRAAQAAYAEAAAQYASTVHGAFQNVADTLAALDQDARTLNAAAEAENAAATSVAIARRAFRYGETSNTAVLSAQQVDETAISVLVQAQAARYADTVALFQALGGGWWNRTDVAAR